ncbi:MAG: hypothetical protein KZQ93_15525 [Candidatus Thiodiazotropha sp. (ex Monitilora ramsayi)]|nr:hypothetical protein [Candidatus Thiodiazotropha sp. (ex Monitilora ramsayi)]
MSGYINKAAVLLSCCLMGAAHADSILTFEKMGAGGKKEIRTVSITGRWLRIDSDAEGGPDYTLMDTGRMIMFEIDDKNKSFRQTHMGKYYWPKDVVPKLTPMREKGAVAGVRCNMIQEVDADKPAATHCMVPGQDVGLNQRKTKTLSRLFLVSRRMDLDWGAATTPDERQVSINSQSLENGESLKFVSAVHKPIPDNRIKIPDEFKQIRVKQQKHKHSE